MADRQALRFTGPAGALDARAAGPVDGAPVLLLHPHPQHGGTMGSRLVYDLAQGLAADGLRTYRFDFRGAGRSEGEYAEGLGEVGDALAVGDAILEKHGRFPVIIGHSFGAGVGIRVAAERQVPALILIGTPPRVRTSRLVPVEDAERVHARTHLIVGAEDEFVSRADALRLARAFPHEAALTVLEGAGHFLEPSHNGRVLAVVRRILAEGRGAL